MDMSFATKEVVMLRRGTLKSLDMILKIVIETPADANSIAPEKIDQKKNQCCYLLII